MKIAKTVLEGIGPYSQSKHIDPLEFPPKPKETKDAYEERLWQHRTHLTADGHVFIPPTAFGNAVRQAARRLQLQIPGKGKTTYTKYFEAGIDVEGPLVLPLTLADVKRERLFVPSDGKPGGGKRVFRNFPRIESWRGAVTFYVIDDAITEDVFRKVLNSAGLLVGIGRFRPENRGFYGRFRVVEFTWIEEGDEVIAA